ncbi:hypothetical protein DFH09DRAFT_1094723 [Mycena vulgaris]|nr:hypothetical protein DFH09DRAFT_1094723 [Mycena vulgaris]
MCRVNDRDDMGVRPWHYHEVVGPEWEDLRHPSFKRERKHVERVIERVVEVREVRVPVEVKVQVPVEVFVPQEVQVPMEVLVPVEVEHLEKGWDDETSPTALVVDPHTKTETLKTIACTARMLDVIHPTEDSNAWSGISLFSDPSLRTTHIFLNVNKAKPHTTAKNQSIIFVVLKGAMRVVLDKTSFILSTGGTCLIPRGNRYSLENVATRRTSILVVSPRREEDEQKLRGEKE